MKSDKRGRPKHVCRSGIRIWSPEMLRRRLDAMIARRDTDDEESLTDVVFQLRRLARQLVSRESLSRERIMRLKWLALHAEPSEIRRELLRWYLDYPDRSVRMIEEGADVSLM